MAEAAQRLNAEPGHKLPGKKNLSHLKRAMETIQLIVR